MKLIDLLLELENTATNDVIQSSVLKQAEERLFECDEFKNVIRVNYVHLPSFLVDRETKEPLVSNKNFIGGETDTINTIVYRGDSDNIKFNKIVDIYTCAILREYDTEKTKDKIGIWIFPTSYDEKYFTPKNEIRIIWNPIQLQEAIILIGDKETPEQRLTRLFADALKSGPNVPCKYKIEIRCSPRSFLPESSKLESPDSTDREILNSFL